jgi:exodeoxyribonuclease VII small subunit
MARSSASAASTPLASPPPPAVAPSYEEALAELDRLVQAMDSGQLPLDRLLDSYRRGAELLQFCRGRLEAVEQQVKVLEDGQLRPWNEEGSA